MSKELKTDSAKKFIKGKKYPDSDIYVFPFQCLDTRKGGSSLGRIMWQVEPIYGRKTKGRYYIEKLLVWVRQTRDKRYMGKVFEIPCYSESLSGSPLEQNSFLNHVWRTSKCEIHKETYFSAYPKDHHTELVINVGRSISIDVNFKG